MLDRSSIPIPPITAKTFEETVSLWLTGIKYNDFTAAVSYPGSDRQRRILNLLDNRELQRKYLQDDPDKYNFVIFDFRTDHIDEVSDLEERLRILLKGKEGKINVFVGVGAEVLLIKKQSAILIWLSDMIRAEKLRTIMFFETNVFNPEAMAVFQEIKSFHPKFTFMKLYENSDVRQFINYLKNGKWEMTLPVRTEEEIIKQCGGSLLFVKLAVRTVRDNPKMGIKDVFETEDIEYALASLWQDFTEIEKGVMTKIALGDIQEIKEEKCTIKYFEATRLIQKLRKSWRISIPLLTKFIKKGASQNIKICWRNGEIMVNNIVVTRQFSKTEEALLEYLLTHENILINRENLGNILWPGNAGGFSDWAIDSILSRLRKRLSHLGIAKDQLKNVKGKGVMWVK